MEQLAVLHSIRRILIGALVVVPVILVALGITLAVISAHQATGCDYSTVLGRCR